MTSSDDYAPAPAPIAAPPSEPRALCETNKCPTPGLCADSGECLHYDDATLTEPAAPPSEPPFKTECAGCAAGLELAHGEHWQDGHAMGMCVTAAAPPEGEVSRWVNLLNDSRMALTVAESRRLAALLAATAAERDELAREITAARDAVRLYANHAGELEATARERDEARRAAARELEAAGKMWENWVTASGKLDAAESALAQARDDAERYRWIRDRMSAGDVADVCRTARTPAVFDHRIDAARAAIDAKEKP